MLVRLFLCVIFTLHATALITTHDLQAFSDAWNAHDIDRLMTYMAEDSIFHGAAGPDMFGKTFQGLDEVRTGFLGAFAAFPDAQWLNPHHFLSADGLHGITESTFVGTKTNPDGSQGLVEVRMVDVFTFDANGKIVVKNAFRKTRPDQPVRESGKEL